MYSIFIHVAKLKKSRVPFQLHVNQLGKNCFVTLHGIAFSITCLIRLTFVLEKVNFYNILY